MKRLFVLSLLTGLIILIPYLSQAEQYEDRLQQHLKRINKGINDGSLTQTEAQTLLDEQKKIEDLIKGARADGILTNAEKREIDKSLEKADNNIEKLKHNKDKVKKKTALPPYPAPPPPASAPPLR
jgi:septal ring factor EnvC (AmiA/AmiB activator)